MQCFRLPESICDDINKMCASFWWGDKNEKRRMHWAKWNKLCKPKEWGGLGFRDLATFNRALVAKQLWRLMKKPESLVAQVFKAKYYRDGDILTAKVKPNCSFVWRSLIWSREIVEKGMRWRVGDGTNIKVFGDKWITGLHEGHILKCDNGDGNLMRVADLINKEREWDVELLSKLFLTHECMGILNTPIGERGKNDEIFWHPEHRGNFSVKTAYLLAMGYYDNHGHISSTDRKLWSKLVWTTSIPPKARVFLWRAMMNFIPTEANLKEHHVLTDGICSFCRDRWASTEHALFFCPRVKKIWKRSRFWDILKKGSALGLVDIASSVRGEFDVEDYELWCIMVWKVWGFICNLIHHEDDRDGETSEEGCKVIWETYQMVRPLQSVDAQLGVRLGEKVWRRPLRGRYRVDVDALFNQARNVFGYGVIIRNYEGKVVVVMSKPSTPSSNALIAEIMAVVHGLVLSIEYDVLPIEVFTDSVVAARVMARPEEDGELLPDDIQDILTAVRQNLLIGVFHMYRSANRAAHCLAQFAATCSRPICWTGGFPSWLMDIVSADLIN